MENNDSSLDFNSDDFSGFFYTNDKQIRRMDDAFILSKIVEKYPDFVPEKGENIVKQVFLVIANDTKFINKLTKELDIDPLTLFEIVYRKYSYIFNKCYINKLQRIIGKKSYARKSRRMYRRSS